MSSRHLVKYVYRRYKPVFRSLTGNIYISGICNNFQITSNYMASRLIAIFRVLHSQESGVVVSISSLVSNLLKLKRLSL